MYKDQSVFVLTCRSRLKTKRRVSAEEKQSLLIMLLHALKVEMERFEFVGDSSFYVDAGIHGT
ncbi:hypothetical protein K439DRAFT_1640216 [Ramaria rubella]|nr:hypothetical protein K439DRAFT_1640216 [Ramaria rubella]